MGGFSTVTSSGRIEELQAQARYYRERLQLYRARIYGSRPTIGARLREIERLSEYADRRLRHAEREALVHRDGETDSS
jgi:hypothetical protein